MAVPVAVALAVTAAACGGNGSGAGDPDPAKDRAAAQRANLKAADLPASWRSEAQVDPPGTEEVENQIARCLGTTSPSSRATAEVESPKFTSGLATQARSVITFVKTKDEATKDAANFASDKFPDCAKEGFTKQVGVSAPEGSTVTDLTITDGKFAALGDRTVARRVTADIQVDPTFSITVYVDLVLIVVDRAEVDLTFVNPGSPFDEDLALELATKVVERL